MRVIVYMLVIIVDCHILSVYTFIDVKSIDRQ